MMDLLIQIQARVQTLTADLILDNPAGNQRAPRVEIGALPPKRSDAGQGEDFPFVVVRPMSGGADRKASELRVDLILGVWTSGDIVSGMTDIGSGLLRLLDIQKNRAFSPYHMNESLTWRLGDEQGMQPHPYYHAAVTMTFKHQPITPK